MDLTAEVLPGLRPADPFLIASSHWTSTEAAFRQLAAVTPAAVTLKTTSSHMGANGEGPRDKRVLVDSYGNPFAGYTDGPRTAELWDIFTTHRMTHEARKLLPSSTLLGLSVLTSEDYEKIARTLDLTLYGYVELNWKYSYRNLDISKAAGHLDDIHEDLHHFIDAFRGKPLLVKLSRETIPYLPLPEFSRILDTVEGAGAGLIVANSKRIEVPPSRVDEQQPKERTSGVVTGEWLFLETYDMIRSIRRKCPTLPVVASGGVADIAGVVDLLAAGANAVQLCTILDRQGPQAVSWLREQLRQLLTNVGDFATWRDSLRVHESPARNNSIVQAREFRWSLQHLLDTVVSQPELLVTDLADTLVAELSGLPELTTKGDRDAMPERARFVITRGNVSALLLAHKYVAASNSIPIQLNSAGDFLREASRGLEYDFTILPESSIQFAANNGRLPGTPNEPVRIGIVGRSIFELVGRKDKDPADVDFVYHFGGTSTRHALESLLELARPGSVQIGTGKLIPLLRFWPENGAILAKPPLSRLYGRLARDDVRASWGPIWNAQEPLTLVAARRFLSNDAGLHAARAVLAWMEQCRQDVVKSPEISAREILNAGFLFDVTKLLNPGK